MPDYAAWGPDGSLYVTDYQQAVIWRVPPRGGRAQVWLADPRLDGDMFGTAGIVLAGDHRTLLFTQTSSAGVSAPLLGTLNPSTGKLYAVTAGARPSGLRQVWESRPVDGPDGFALGRSGDAYVALVGSNQIVQVAPDGRELDRFPALPLTGDNGSSVPFDNPSSAMFLGTRIMVANQSFIAGNRDNQAILDVEVGERGLPVFVPANAGPRVARTHRRAKPQPHTKRRGAHRRRGHTRPRFTG
jgi:sugar lactone lactonase YvrE